MRELDAAAVQAQHQLSALLNACKGGDTIKQARIAWLEAAGASALVRSVASLAPYVPAIEAEEQQAESAWAEARSVRAQLRDAKQLLGTLQGRLFAHVEVRTSEQPLGAQAQAWANEHAEAEEVLREQAPLLQRRRGRLDAFHMEQGKLRAWARLWELLGSTEEERFGAVVERVTRSASQTRLQCKALVAANKLSDRARDEAQWELAVAAGAAETAEALLAHGGGGGGGGAAAAWWHDGASIEHAVSAAEAEAESLRRAIGGMSHEAPEARRLVLAWHSAVGEEQAARVLGVGVVDAEAGLRKARAAADVGEALRIEKLVLEGELGMLEGRLRLLQTAMGVVHATAAAPDGVAAATAATVAEEQATRWRLRQWRHRTMLRELECVLLKRDAAEARAHAAGGALLLARRVHKTVSRQRTRSQLEGDQEPAVPTRPAITHDVASHTARDFPTPPSAAHARPVPFHDRPAPNLAANAPPNLAPQTELHLAPQMALNPSPNLAPTTARNLAPKPALRRVEVPAVVSESILPMVRAALAATLASRDSNPLAAVAEWLRAHASDADAPARAPPPHAPAPAASATRAVVPQASSARTSSNLSLKAEIADLRAQAKARRAELVKAAQQLCANLPREEQLASAEQMLELLTPRGTQHGTLFRFREDTSEIDERDTDYAASDEVVESYARALRQHPLVSAQVYVRLAPAVGAVGSRQEPDGAAARLAHARGERVRTLLVRYGVDAARVRVRVGEGAAPTLMLVLEAEEPKASAGVVSRHEASLTSARASFESALQRLLAQPLPPPRASRLRVRILEMGVSVPPPGATHFGVLLAFGPIAVAVAGSTEVAVANAAVTEVDFELIDVPRNAPVADCTISVQPLISGAETEICADLVFISADRVPVGSMRVLVEAVGEGTANAA